MPWTDELHAAREAARKAAAIVMAVYAKDFAVDWKGVGDPVTVADRSANEEIVRLLRARFPNDAICSEEGVPSESAAQSGRGGRCWFVDPLDGTREFVAKNGEFCVMIALAVDGLPVLGCVLAPVWKREFVGVVGEGAYMLDLSDESAQPQPLRVSDSADGPLKIAVSRSHREPEVNTVAKALNAEPVVCGSVGLKVALVAQGDASLYLHTGSGAKLWDGCAPQAIATAMGATFTDARGGTIRYDSSHLPLDRGILVAPPILHARALALLTAK